MIDAQSAIEAALAESENLRKVLSRSRSAQVRTSDEKLTAKALAKTWFAKHRLIVNQSDILTADNEIDIIYKIILEFSEKNCTRRMYIATIGKLKKALIKLRSDLVITPPTTTLSSDQEPDFSPLISDPAMQQILLARWRECVLCLKAGASLAATVMMGGLLEALLLARVNRESNKSTIFKAKSAPQSAKTNAPKPLNEWMLNDFIKVLSELKWISASATATGSVLRDYRNYVHPQKQLSHDMHLTTDDAALFWEITKSITRQVIQSTP